MSFNTSSPVLVAYLGGICVGFGVFSIFHYHRHYVIKEKKLEKANIYINKNKLVNYQLRIPFYSTKYISICSVAAPKLMKSISNSLINEDEKNITMDRINSFKAMSKQSVRDIRQKVFEKYSEYAVSELLSDEEEEEEEGEQSYLYRQTTPTHWSNYDLNNMENDMKKQLNMLKTQSESFINNKPKSINNKSINNKRSLFRCKSSYKWDYDDVEINKKEMQEQIIYLIHVSQ